MILSAIVMLFMGISVTQSVSSSSKIEWMPYTKGMAVGKATGKKMFVNFYADWCAYCKEMDKNTFTNTDVINYISHNFIPIKVNSDLEQKTAARYNVRGLPTTLFLSKSGEQIGFRPGYIPADTMLILLKYVYSESYQNMSLKDFTEKSGE